jgi:hypothetical protein
MGMIGTKGKKDSTWRWWHHNMYEMLGRLLAMSEKDEILESSSISFV